MVRLLPLQRQFGLAREQHQDLAFREALAAAEVASSSEASTALRVFFIVIFLLMVVIDRAATGPPSMSNLLITHGRINSHH